MQQSNIFTGHFFAYRQIEFGCKRLTGLELIKDVIEPVIFWLYNPHYDLDLEDKIPPLFFLHDILAYGQNTKFGYKTLHINTQLPGNKYMSITSLTPEDTTVLSLL